NKFPTKFIKQFNSRFAIRFSKLNTIRDKAPAKSERDLILAECSRRTIDGGNTVRYHVQAYTIYDRYSRQKEIAIKSSTSRKRQR
ncbi:hypothetical protein NWP07_11905, partial [Weissella cibaria]|uniref:hypothetical protein n=1 Tax=Weissella cibaria TaxID=137591 RepID=UPI00215A914A